MKSSTWIGIARELEGVKAAVANVSEPEVLARYLYDRISAYIGPDHERVAVALMEAALSENRNGPPESEGESDHE